MEKSAEKPETLQNFLVGTKEDMVYVPLDIHGWVSKLHIQGFEGYQLFLENVYVCTIKGPDMMVNFELMLRGFFSMEKETKGKTRTPLFLKFAERNGIFLYPYTPLEQYDYSDPKWHGVLSTGNTFSLRKDEGSPRIEVYYTSCSSNL